MKSKTEQELIRQFEATFGKIVGGSYAGTLYLWGYGFALPSSITTTGYLYLLGYGEIKIGKHKLSYKNIDSLVFIIESERTSKGIRIYKGYNFVSMTDNVIEKQPCYVAEKDGFYAHGETLKKAIRDVQFKIVAEKIKKDPIYPDTELTVMYYRTITGACDHGCRSFMDKHKIAYRIEGDETVEVKPMKAKDLLPLLKGKYGYEKFKSLITF